MDPTAIFVVKSLFLGEEIDFGQSLFHECKKYSRSYGILSTPGEVPTDGIGAAVLSFSEIWFPELRH